MHYFIGTTKLGLYAVEGVYKAVGRVSHAISYCVFDKERDELITLDTTEHSSKPPVPPITKEQVSEAVKSAQDKLKADELLVKKLAEELASVVMPSPSHNGKFNTAYSTVIIPEHCTIEEKVPGLPAVVTPSM